MSNSSNPSFWAISSLVLLTLLSASMGESNSTVSASVSITPSATETATTSVATSDTATASATATITPTTAASASVSTTAIEATIGTVSSTATAATPSATTVATTVSATPGATTVATTVSATPGATTVATTVSATPGATTVATTATPGETTAATTVTVTIAASATATLATNSASATATPTTTTATITTTTQDAVSPTTAPNKVAKVIFTMKFPSFSYKVEFEDPNSAAYKETIDPIVENVKFATKADNVGVKEIREGNLIITFNITFTFEAGSDPLATLTAIVTTGKVGNYSIDPTYPPGIKIEGADLGDFILNTLSYLAGCCNSNIGYYNETRTCTGDQCDGLKNFIQRDCGHANPKPTCDACSLVSVSLTLLLGFIASNIFT